MASDRELMNAAWAKRCTMRSQADKLRSEEGHILADGYKMLAAADLWWGMTVGRIHGNVPMYWHTDGSCTVNGHHYLVD